MVSHTQLQYYSHNYALVCMTGLLGCRWHRYKQSTKGSRKRDLAWFSFVLLVALFVVFCFYSYLVGQNDGDFQYINRFMYDNVRNWFDWSSLVLAAVSIFFTYLVIILLLCLCHIVRGHQLYIHPSHLVVTFIILAALVALTIVLLDLTESQTDIIYFSLKIFGPFLQIGAVCLLTVLTWVVSHQWFKITHSVWKVVWCVVYIVMLVGVYVSPLLINSPCVILEENLPAKPKLSGHRGASSLAPENTVISFEIASKYDVFAFETDVHMSYDGVPFLMHNTLRATTNVEQLYPDLVDADPSYFNLSQLQQLDAGSWFLEFDPWHSASSVSSESRTRYRNQTVPTLLELLHLAARTSTHVMFDINTPPSNHPFHNTTNQVIIDTIKASGINQSLILWLMGDEIPDNLPSSFKVLSRETYDVEVLKQRNFTGVHYQTSIGALDRIKSYRDSGLFSSVYLVNSVWLYSFHWCFGVDMVATDVCDVLSRVKTPLWHMVPRTYRAVWLTIDLVSVVLVAIMFVIQRSRASQNKFKPEHLSLSVNTDSNPFSHKRTRRSMKEKLLMRDVQAEMFDFEPDENLGIESSGYDATVNASEGRALSEAFQSHRASYHSNITELSQDGIRSNRHSVTSGYDENGISQYNMDGQGDVFNTNRNSYHSNGSTYQTEAEITYDGVPFLMHNTLRATTNVEQLYHDLVDADPSSFNLSQLQQLDAGGWFLEFDPWHSASSVSSEARTRYRNQTVPTLLELLHLAARTSTHVMFDINTPPSNHPFHNTTNQVIIDTIKASGINQSLIFWLMGDEIPDDLPSSFKVLSRETYDVEVLKQRNFTGVHYQTSVGALDRIKSYRDSGLFSSVYLVNSVWLYSFHWCFGVDMVATDVCDVLSRVKTPLWHMAPRTYRAVWLTIDLVSVVLVAIMFVIQRSRASQNKFKPEHLSLSVNTDSNPFSHKRTRRSMKEKLLMRDVQAEMFDFEPDENLGIESSGYDATVNASEGRALSEAFQSHRASYHSNITELSQDGLNSNRHSVTSGYDENGISQYNMDGQGDGFDTNRNSYHSNGSTYQTEAEIT